MIFLVSMLYLLITQLYHLLLIHARILPMLEFTHHPQIRVEVSMMVLISTITGLVHLFPTRYLLLMLSQEWMCIIIVGIIILLSLWQAVVLVLLISPRFPLLLRELPGPMLISQDQDLLSLHSLLVTGMICVIKGKKFVSD